MAVPYHVLKVCGSIIFAARGSDIHSFNSSLEHISTWNYPVKQEGESSGPVEEAQESPAPEGPPAKRRKVQGGKGQESNGHEKSKNGNQKATNPPSEKPFIQGLYTTTDGRHLVAITGSDKTIWVFEHDGAGNLKQLSQRTMPKRPCSLALTLDNKTILSADKFGDVYALPLIPSSTPTPSSPSAALPPTTTTTTTTSNPVSRSATPSTPAGFKPQADEFTVHTKRNLRALEHQKLSLERRAAALEQQRQHQFEHTLLLGHVSMLTAICVGVSNDGKREYIITADRDEHIRVSRGMPQAHVIEGFCLGHEDFVSRLCVLGEVLVSGGGDDDLFVWDWVNGQLIGRAGLLEHVKEVEEGATKVAVLRLVASQLAGAKTVVFVVCERVPAVFCYELLEDKTLRHQETIRTPGNVLDVEVLDSTGPSPRLLVAVDASTSTEAGSSLIVMDKETEAGWRQSSVQNLPAAADINIGAQELQKILYSTESLRKLTDFD